ncbi:DUF4179 domain-containing protein [Paenibacillus tritici]|uniref:DUF4179 domain-containing protein n=1 Tax=Paenibacillus tritici TaxID=1873425 RepID=A0ABX2DH61_9BACL|nr:DUF4179 domain-containing protein [Paenibacillus tritici]NQX43810.1 DUF4179 domain-containing protein [Paenibacillus tritici]
MVRTEEDLLKEYYQSLSAEAEEIAEMKLNTAIRRGLTRSRRPTRSLTSRYVLGTVAILGIVLLFSIPWAGERLKSQGAALDQAAIFQSYGQFEKYIPALISNATVSSAIETGLVQSISGVTAEQNGFVLTVDGIAADQKGIIILYSLQNNTEERANVNFMQLTGSSLNPLHSSRGAGTASTPNGITYGYEVLQWEKGYSSLPDQITFELELGEYKQFSPVAADTQLAKLSVAIPLDRGQIAKSGQTIHVDQTMAIDGQEIEINEVYLAASGIYLDYSCNPLNSKQIFSMYKPRMLVGSGGDYTNLELRSAKFTDSKSRLIFSNDSRSTESLQLQIGGILALDKEKTQLIIDTEQQKIIKSPDQNLHMSLHNTNKGSTMVLEYYSQAQSNSIYNTFMLDSTFTDGAGKVHETGKFDISIPPRKEPENAKLIPHLNYQGLGSNKYPQPLTFTITSYPNLIKEKLSLSIR